MEIKQYTLKQPMSQKYNTKEIRKYFKTNENENTTYQNISDFIVKAVLIEKFIGTMAYILKRKISNQQSNFTP